jgi:protein O-mannosyl-transferase
MSLHLRFVLVLAVITLLSMGHVCGNGFIDLDDIPYITQNPNVKSGLTGENILWALTTTRGHFWQPVTWLSLQLDATLFGPEDAWGFHLTNLLLHLANVLLLYRLLVLVSQRAWPSFWVAALFAVHPLHVESVAWAVERKDVLSTLFWLLATIAYVRYAAQPGRGRMTVVVVFFALGLMTKPMVVTFPFTLLLLDVWPLRRWPQGQGSSSFSQSSPGGLVAEKIPLFLLAIAGAVGVLAIKSELGEVVDLSLTARLVNAVTSYGWYLWKTVLPFGLGVYYSHGGEDWEAGPAIISALTLAAITVWAILIRRNHPYVLIGWCGLSGPWFR